MSTLVRYTLPGPVSVTTPLWRQVTLAIYPEIYSSLFTKEVFQFFFSLENCIFYAPKLDYFSSSDLYANVETVVYFLCNISIPRKGI